MTLLDELIFVADVVEDNRTYSDLDYYQDLAYRDLDRACLEILEYTIGDLTSKGREVAQAIAELLSRKKAKDVVMIDIAEKSSFADFFVIATGTSDRQLGALADDVEDKFAELGIDPKSKDGRPDTGWILVDGGDVIVNIFTNDTRDKYTLEKIWSDCESILVD